MEVRFLKVKEPMTKTRSHLIEIKTQLVVMDQSETKDTVRDQSRVTVGIRIQKIIDGQIREVKEGNQTRVIIDRKDLDQGREIGDDPGKDADRDLGISRETELRATTEIITMVNRNVHPWIRNQKIGSMGDLLLAKVTIFLMVQSQ